MDPTDTPVVDPAAADPAAAQPDASSAPAQSDDASTGVTADSPPASADPVSDSQDPPAQPQKGRAQERIEELARDNRLLREHNEWLREQVLSTRPQPAQPQQPAAQPTPEPEDLAPTLESCGFDSAKLSVEQAKWMQRQIDRGVKKGVSDALSERDVQTEARTQEQIVRDAADKFRQEHPDFDLLVGNPKLNWTQTVADALKEAGEDSPAIGYYLAQNPDKLAKIGRMKPQQVAMRLGEIAAEVKAAAKTRTTPPKAPSAPAATPPAAPAKKPVTTNAPPPPTPVGGSQTSDVDPMTLSPAEWRKWRNQQLAAKREGGQQRPARVVRNI